MLGVLEPSFHTIPYHSIPFHTIPYHAMNFQKPCFEAPGSWVTLGGSPAGAAYLEKQHQTGISMVQSQGCSDAQEDDARAICSKHLQQTTHPETFADCVYDLCHGGDESFAQSAAAFLSPLEESSA